jgi:ApbE superfamily uncharacterized protein (UPF0280 family)
MIPGPAVQKFDDRVKPGHDNRGATPSRQQARTLAGGRLHLQDGPIDLIIGADGEPSAVERAYSAAAARFATVLDELCEELVLLRVPAIPGALRLAGPVAQRMERAVSPFAAEMFITPMAAVAGAVAEEILEAMTCAASLSRAYVNNGGDIALHLGPYAAFTIGLISRPDRPSLFSTARLTAKDGVFGIATSGWRGRSFSLGIADAVTVLAESAAKADAAATVAANAVDLPGHASIVREPACDLQPDSDLGQRLVTREVGALKAADVEEALERGAGGAVDLLRRKLIHGAALHLQGVTKIVCADAQPSLSWPGSITPSSVMKGFHR